MFLELLKDFLAHIFFMCCFLAVVWVVVLDLFDKTKPFNFDAVLERNKAYDLQRIKNEMMQAESRVAESALVNRFDYESECQ